MKNVLLVTFEHSGRANHVLVARSQRRSRRAVEAEIESAEKAAREASQS